METKILVLYVGIAGIRSEDVPTYTEKIANKILPKNFIGEMIVIPVQSPYTSIDCINPKYVTDENLIIEHTEKMKKLQHELNVQLEILRKNNYG